MHTKNARLTGPERESTHKAGCNMMVYVIFRYGGIRSVQCLLPDLGLFCDPSLLSANHNL